MKTKAGKIGIPVILILGFFWVMMGMPPAARIGFAPEQPIHYSHKLHAGDYNIDCQYCHTGVTTGKKAGVPPVSVCMNCHGSVGFESEELNNLRDNYYYENKSPEWIRVHNMPDHVRFSHAPHINRLSKKGEPTKEVCKQCHGDVASMEVVEQVESLNMGFCVDCHEQNEELGAKINCSTCHY